MFISEKVCGIKLWNLNPLSWFSTLAKWGGESSILEFCLCLYLIVCGSLQGIDPSLPDGIGEDVDGNRISRITNMMSWTFKIPESDL
jgi:hypothetical protein